MLIDPDVFEVCFTGWVGILAPPVTPGESGGRDHGWQDVTRFLRPGPGAVAAASSQRVGQVSVAWYWANATWTISPTRSRPELLDRLVLANTLVTLGAMGCQKDIA